MQQQEILKMLHFNTNQRLPVAGPRGRSQRGQRRRADNKDNNNNNNNRHSDDDKDEMCQRGQRKRAEMMKVLIVSHCLQTKNKHPFSSIDNVEKIGVNK